MKTSLAATLLAIAAIAASAQPSGVLGNWKTKAGSIVSIGRCGEKVCFTLIELAPNIPTTDIHNPDPAQHNRPLCYLRIGSGFTLSDPNHAAGGTLYDPKSGKTYHGQVTLEGEKLHLRGYVGIPLFGASETWTRPAEPVRPCNGPQRSR